MTGQAAIGRGEKGLSFSLLIAVAALSIILMPYDGHIGQSSPTFLSSSSRSGEGSISRHCVCVNALSMATELASEQHDESLG